MQYNDKSERVDCKFMANSGGAPEIYTIVVVVRTLVFVWYGLPRSDMRSNYLQKLE